VLRFLLQSPWLRRLFAALVGLALGLILVTAWTWWNQRSLQNLANNLMHAYVTRDIQAMENLFCWEGVDEKTRSRVRLAILQEFELTVETVSVKPLLPTDGQDGPGLRPNLKPDGTIEVIYATPDRLSAAFLAGRQGLSGHRLIVMIPGN
jgi:hypothetical protein